MNIIDRFEGEFAVVETDSGMIDVPRAELPENAAEGDVLVNNEGTWYVDENATEERRSSMRSRLRGLIRND